MPNIRGSELLILLLVVAVLFGAKRMPEAARSLGRSMRIFKAETKGLVESEAYPSSAPAITSAEQVTTPPAPTAEAPPAPQPSPQGQPPTQT